MDATIDAFYQAYNTGDAATAASLYHPEGEHSEAAMPHVRKGTAALAGGMEYFFSMFDELRWEEIQRIRAGKSVLVSYVMTGKLVRDAGRIKARGQAISLTGAHLFEFEDDKLQKTRDFWDPSEFARQAA